MSRLGLSVCCGFAFVLLIRPAGPAAADELKPLFEIGTADNNTAELALGPKDYAKYAEDPLFVAGRSEAKRDWPYVQPGPGDAWAGGRQHDFAIAFALAKKPSAEFRLDVDLVDTHDRMPPKLLVLLNGRPLTEHQTPAGGPDDSIFGNPAKGREHKFSVVLPADALAAGTNEITIRTLTGSWILYDRVALLAPAGTELAPRRRPPSCSRCPASRCSSPARAS